MLLNTVLEQRSLYSRSCFKLKLDKNDLLRFVDDRAIFLETTFNTGCKEDVTSVISHALSCPSLWKQPLFRCLINQIIPARNQYIIIMFLFSSRVYHMKIVFFLVIGIKQIQVSLVRSASACNCTKEASFNPSDNIPNR